MAKLITDLPQNIDDKLRERAEASGQSKTAIVKEAIYHFLREEQ